MSNLTERWYRTGFLGFDTIDNLDATELFLLLFFFAGGGVGWGGRDLPVHCRMFSSILGLYPADASSIPHPVVTIKTIKNVSRNCKMFLGNTIAPG